MSKSLLVASLMACSLNAFAECFCGKTIELRKNCPNPFANMICDTGQLGLMEHIPAKDAPYHLNGMYRTYVLTGEVEVPAGANLCVEGVLTEVQRWGSDWGYTDPAISVTGVHSSSSCGR
jgi:hypothetical protein